MITISNRDDLVKVSFYPDGTPNITFPNPDILQDICEMNYPVWIQWYATNYEELTILQLIVSELHDRNYRSLKLYMPYVPFARMDRTETNEDVASLKHFGKIINSMKFQQVKVLDPHSSVVEAVIDNCLIVHPTQLIQNILNEIGNIDCIFYPDQGSEKRYKPIHKDFNLPYLTAYKQRDWRTGKIEKLQILGDTYTIKGKNFLIVDDICSKGGTFLYAAKALKEHGANDIYLYITHCEKSILDGELIDRDDLLKKIYTTNSIFINTHPMIEVFNVRK